MEINGQKIDTTTGKVIGVKKTVKNNSTQKVIDGFVRIKPATTQNLVIKNQALNTKRAILSPAPTKKPRLTKPIEAIVHHSKTQHSKTLIRSFVSKPSKTAPQIHSTKSLANSTVEKSASGRGLLLRRVPDNRLNRANTTDKNAAVSRFPKMFDLRSNPSNAILPVTKLPKDNTPPQAPPTLIKPRLGEENGRREVFNHPTAKVLIRNTQKKNILKSFVGIFTIKPKLIFGFTLSLSLLAGIGYFAYLKIPTVNLKIVNAKSGFSATIPSITPSGFNFKGPMQFSDGAVVQNFSTTDHKAFSIVQRPSSLTSESLLSKYIISSNYKYQTYSEKGLDVYIYGADNAMWVNNGIWYSVVNHGNLSSGDILALAGSM
jgi:hypothetical protein